MCLALSVTIGKGWVESYMEIQDIYLLLRIFRFSSLWILLRKLLMTDKWPSRSDIDLADRPLCLEHLAFHWFSNFLFLNLLNLE